ncbi:MAG: hypothetical protein ACM37W_02220 [Actinomycetota bacterium]
MVESLRAGGGSWWRFGGVAVEEWWVSAERLPLLLPVPPLLLFYSAAKIARLRGCDR